MATREDSERMAAVIRKAVNWKKRGSKGSEVIGMVGQDCVSLEKKGSDTILVVVKGPRGHEKARSFFGYKDTVFGAKHKEVIGCKT